MYNGLMSCDNLTPRIWLYLLIKVQDQKGLRVDTFVVSTVSADDLALFGARTSASTVLTKFGSHIWIHAGIKCIYKVACRVLSLPKIDLAVTKRGCNLSKMIYLMAAMAFSYCDTSVIVQSAYWLLMSWHLFFTRTSAAIMIVQSKYEKTHHKLQQKQNYHRLVVNFV